MKDSLLYYSIGPLLYCPANSENIVDSLLEEKLGTYFSLALCLEDTIRDDRVEEAEEQLIRSLSNLYIAKDSVNCFLPKLFIRVRDARQIPKLLSALGEARMLVCGFIIPKFCLENADVYIEAIKTANDCYNQTFYLMPILESPTMLHLGNRHDILYQLKEKIDTISPWILNIRVGGNDLCHVFGFRRAMTQTIYDIKPIANLFSDIMTVFGPDYIVSGPVWEYYNGKGWDKGLTNELELDRINGFIGKTVIHPNQIPLVNESFKVSSLDYQDALSILDWSEDNKSMVSGNASSERMNEYKTHYHWARSILMLAKAYGIKGEQEI